MRTKICFAFVGITLLASSLSGKDRHPPSNHDAQSICENETIRNMGAKEILAGPEYEIFMSVVIAFGRDKAPRLYFFEGDEGTGNNAYYIAGSVILDGRGKILISRQFVEIMGITPALKGSMAHEMAHLIRNPATGERCTDWVYLNPQTEREADAIAAGKVGFQPLKAWLLRVSEWAGEKSFSDTLGRIEALETQQKEQRN